MSSGRQGCAWDGEPEAGWAWDTLGLGGALPCCQNIPTGEPRLLRVEAQVAFFCPALSTSRTLCNCFAL